MKTPFLSVFTPSYNRSRTLPRVYESLKAQTCKDFEWIIIDDGSTDHTDDLVRPWLDETEFHVRYYYKENGGLHTTYNLAIEKMDDTTLAVCIDSDDFMPPEAVERIKTLWEKSGGQTYGGIIGLDYDMQHNLIGGLFPDPEINAIDYSLGKLNIAPGDKKYVCRTDLYKKTGPQPVFPGEKYFNPSWRNREVARICPIFLTLNEEICTVDYQAGGLSKNKLKQYKNSPNGYMCIRKQTLSFKGIPFKSKAKTIIHYICEALLAKKYWHEWSQAHHKWLMILLFPVGFGLSLYVRLRG